MRVYSVLIASFLASTTMVGTASSDIYFRIESQTFEPVDAVPSLGTESEDVGIPGMGTRTEVGTVLTGETQLAYGGDWDILIEATNAASYSMVLTGPLPDGIMQYPDGSGIRLFGRTTDGSYDLGVVVTADGKTSTLPVGTVSVAAPDAPLALTASKTSAVFYPSQDWDILFDASGGMAPYTFVSTVGLPSTIVPVPGATSLALTGRAPAGNYPGISLSATDTAGKEIWSSAVTVRVMASDASVAPTGQLASHAVYTAVPQAQAASFTVTNTGQAPSGAVAVAMPTGSGDFALGGTCATGAEVAANEACTVTLTRTPGIADDTKTGSFTVSFANGGTGAGSATGSATGYVPKVEFSTAAGSLTATAGTPWSYDFDSVVAKTNLTEAGLTWSSTDKPAWMSISPTTGIGSGTPPLSSRKNASFDVLATNERAGATKAFTIVVGGTVLSATQMAGGLNHTCAVTTEGAAVCWGSNSNGQLGDGTTTQSLVPVQVSGLGSGVSSISAGGVHTCAVTTGGSVKCWGSNANGQLGDGSTTQSPVPVQVSGLGSGATTVSAGLYHSCAIVGGSARCWGYNGNGNLGNGTTTQSSVPVQVSGLTSGVTVVSSGYLNHTCAVADGAAKCWGDNAQGQLGDATKTKRLIPVQVSGLTSGVTSISAKSRHSCAVANGAARCWGWNGSGELGNGTTAQSSIPVQVSGLTSGVTSVSLGSAHGCALSGGSVRCWGSNNYGQLGDGSTTQSLIPVQVSGLTSGVSRISAGDYQVCASSGGIARCWGYNYYGQLGDGSTANGPTPGHVSNF